MLTQIGTQGTVLCVPTKRRIKVEHTEPSPVFYAIKASFSLTENILVGTATAVAAGIATHIGTTIARESNKRYANTERRMAK